VPDKKPEHVDLIEEATWQNLPRTDWRTVIEPDIKEKRRLSYWRQAYIAKNGGRTLRLGGCGRRDSATAIEVAREIRLVPAPGPRPSTSTACAA
jgi:hypothetical protein